MNISIDAADKYFSLFIRASRGWKCEKCGKQYRKDDRRGLELSHYHSRRHENTRFDEKNSFSLCFSCHAFFTGNPHEHRLWVLGKLGQVAYDALVLRANTVCPIKRRQYRKEQAQKWRQELKNKGWL